MPQIAAVDLFVVPIAWAGIHALECRLLPSRDIAKLAEFVIQIPTAPRADVIVGILTLADLTLTANLIIIVICSSYENLLLVQGAADGR